MKLGAILGFIIGFTIDILKGALTRLGEENEKKICFKYSTLMNEIIKEERQKQYVYYPKSVIDKSITEVRYIYRKYNKGTKIYARECLHKNFEAYKIAEKQKEDFRKQKERKKILVKLNNLPDWKYEKVITLFLQYKKLDSLYSSSNKIFEKEKIKKQIDSISKEMSDIVG